MRSFKTAVLSSVALAGLITACKGPDVPTPGGLAPFRSDWETVAMYPVGPDGTTIDGLTEITIGGFESSNNFANRGDVEVYFVDTAREVPGYEGLGAVDHVIIQMREFTFAADDATAQEDFDNLEPWLFPVSGSPSPPDNFDPGDECNPRDPDSGLVAVDGTCEGSGAPCFFNSDCGGAVCNASSLLGFANSCQVRLYWRGQNQNLRAGADIRVFLPSSFEGRVNVTTEDNIQEAQDYPDLSDITILDLAGSATIEGEAARVNVRLADGVEPVPRCDAQTQQDCLDMGWTPMLPCATACTEFGRVQVRPRGQQPMEVVVDAPATLWTTAKLTNTLPGLTDEGECKVDIGGTIPEGAPADCGDFGQCECLDCEANLPFKRRVEINKPSVDSVSGLGYSIDVESGDCTEKEFVDGPDDFMAPKSELRGNLALCSGCLDGMSAPALP